MAGRGVNKVVLVGNLGADPEVRYSQSGTAIANLRLATADRRKDRDSGEWVDHTEWHRVVFFGRTAEVAEQYLRKGSQIYLEGRLQTRKWQDKEGQDRYNTEIVGNDMIMLGRRGDSLESPSREGADRPAASQGGGRGKEDARGRGEAAPKDSGPRDEPPAGQQPSSGQPPSGKSEDSGAPPDDFDDDIPF